MKWERSIAAQTRPSTPSTSSVKRSKQTVRRSGWWTHPMRLLIHLDGLTHHASFESGLAQSQSLGLQDRSFR